MKEQKEIGDIFREAFQEYERKPSEKIWQNIESQGVKPISKPYLTPKNLFFGLGSAAIISMAIYFVWPSEKTINTSALIAKHEQVITQPSDNNSTPYSIETKQKTAENQNITTTKNSTTSVQNINQTQTTNINTPAQEIQNKQSQNNINPISITSISNNPVPVITPKPVLTNSTRNQNYAPNTIPETEKRAIVISFTPNQRTCRGEKVKLEAIGGVNWLWSTGERTSSIFVTPESTENYSVVVTDEYGSKHTGLIEVAIENCDVVYVPNAFTPNQDGYYDEFKAVGTNVKEFEILVFSRNGQLVFQSKDINQGWDGTIKGSPGPGGVYVYKLKYIDALNKPHQLSGSLTLIR